jgi:uncharacterized protein
MSERPWYRQSWPWLLISGPAAVLLAGAATLWLAISSADGLVAEDYYKQGLAINRRLAREDEARRLGISAAVTLRGERLRIDLRGEKPEALFVHLAHATRAGHDVRLRLAPVPDGGYEADTGALPAGRWHVVIEDPRARWRIAREAS